LTATLAAIFAAGIIGKKNIIFLNLEIEEFKQKVADTKIF